jgi:integrase
MKGHVRRRGNSWELRAYVGVDPTTGRPKYLTRTFRGGKREADEALARFVTEVSGGGHAAKDTTLSELIRRWLDLVREDLSPSTVCGYERIIRSYIEPDIGRVSLAKLRTDQLDRYSKLRDEGGQDGGPLSPPTVRQTHAVIRRALNQAMRWGWIASNPASLARPPRVRTRALNPPESDGVLRLIAEAEHADSDLACFLLLASCCSLLAATTGARRGELCALRWSDLDMKTGALTISRSIVETQGSTLIEKDTKTHSSRRIALDSGSIAALADQRERCQRRAKSCGTRLADSGHVFSVDPDAGRPWVPNEVTKQFIRIRRSVGLDSVRLHDLRHFTATRLLSEGVPVRTVSGRLGHANAATTLGVYAHFVEESDRDAADKIGSILTRRSEGRPRK